MEIINLILKWLSSFLKFLYEKPVIPIITLLAYIIYERIKTKFAPLDYSAKITPILKNNICGLLLKIKNKSNQDIFVGISWSVGNKKTHVHLKQQDSGDEFVNIGKRTIIKLKHLLQIF